MIDDGRKQKQPSAAKGAGLHHSDKTSQYVTGAAKKIFSCCASFQVLLYNDSLAMLTILINLLTNKTLR